MSDTPRTDLVNGYVRCVWTEHSAQLERELNAANADVERLTKSNLQLREGCEELQQRIKHREKVRKA